MFPILLSVLVLLVLVALIARSRYPRAYGFLLAIPIGMLVYFALGIGIARRIGAGRFYSVPRGGVHISEGDILVSLTFWICCAGMVIYLILRRRNRIA